MDNIIYAGFWRRLAAVLIDTLILWVPASLFSWCAPFFNITGNVLDIADLIYITFVWALYYGFMESSKSQATLGKQVMGIMVVTYTGEKISFLKATGRYLGQFISALFLGIGFLMIGWTEKKQGIHDMLVKCLVIKTAKSPVAFS